MIYYDHSQAMEQYWQEANGCHQYKYGISFKVSDGTRILNDFVTFYDGYDTNLWHYKQYHAIGVLLIVYVNDMDWQVLCKLHGLKTDKLATGVITNPRFVNV